jgi:hypothetical protein
VIVMATVIKNTESVEWASMTSKARFPWAEWTDGKAREVVQGVDFQSPPGSFTAQLRTRAKDNNLKVKYAVTPEADGKAATVIFQFEK